MPAALPMPAHAELSSAELPPLESRDIGTRPAPKAPQDMLLPGETLRSRWADPQHPQAPGREASLPAVPAKPRGGQGRPAAGLPAPLTITPIPAAPAPVAAPAPAPARTPAKPAKPGKIRFGDAACDGGYHLEGVAVDAAGRPCGLF
ncbi:hypothetical protein DKG75_05295 [Zavarzinia compransoris]|uniref:Uncharacterized protein n=2 Tax=Zavarzinia compransoris TaxID=1264899 RepID=A0A317ECD7_9PROT|nr:hypothetical protein DKG75_05295 [Zavarzinia compransoris]